MDKQLEAEEEDDGGDLWQQLLKKQTFFEQILFTFGKPQNRNLNSETRK